MEHLTELKPKSFVQIHYHDRLGGVGKVMNCYSDAARCIQSVRKDMIVCHAPDSRRGAFRNRDVVSLKRADYHFFRTTRAFHTWTAALFGQLRRLLDGDNLPRPCCVVGHNMTLAKNPALSAAFAQCARHYSNSDDMLFFSVIHDFAEEGRVQLMNHMRALQQKGIAVYDILYPDYDNVVYVTLNSRNFTLLQKAGFRVRLLPNPVEAPLRTSKKLLSKDGHTRITRMLTNYAQKAHMRFDPQRSVLFYPVRLISRKNIPEALLLSSLIYDANLVLGGYGTSYGDNVLAREMVCVARENGLFLLCDVDAASGNEEKKRGEQVSLFTTMFCYADACISTSVAEGFGYALFDPWMYDKPLIGRVPLGMRQLKGPAWLPHLYTSFMIPLSWIDLDGLRKQYWRQLQRCFGPRYYFSDPAQFRNEFEKQVTDGSVIDFGYLDWSTQLQLLRRCAQQPSRTECLRKLNPQLMQQYRFITDAASVQQRTRRIKEKIIEELSFDAFVSKFRGCFGMSWDRSQRVHTQTSSARAEMIERHFAHLANFRLLCISRAH
jgi:hypothetical protein